jgi:conjugative relaxase-like TrwC/TraI family protein
MLSISSAKHAVSAVSYFSDHLVEENAANPHEDYYVSHGEAGQWLGSGAEALGFSGEVSAEDFGRALLAIDENGEPLVQNANDPNRRAGWDLTFSSPKSVSTLWAAGDNELSDAIKQAHSQVVERAMLYLQEDNGIISRRGKGGKELENSKLIAARFDHGTSREQDPQLHSHVFVMNLAQRADGSFGTIQSAEFFKRKMAAGAVYRAELAAKLQEMGFSIERDKKSFKVAGVSEDLQKHWSKRRAQVLSELENSASSNAKSAERAALKTRSAKEEVDREELVDRWHAEAAEYGLTQEAITELQQEQVQKLEMPDFKTLWNELTEQASTLSDNQLKARVLEASQAVLNADEALDFVQNVIHSEETITLRDAAGNKRYTSREMYELESALIENAKKRQNEQHAISKSNIDIALSKVPTISDEQREMVEHVLGDEGISLVEGRAGTGKSFSLGVARDAWQMEGKNVIGAALAGKAAAGLEEGAVIKSQTLHSLLFELNEDELGNPPKRTLTANDVIVIDEAGMVGSRMMSELLSKAEAAGSKVVLVGDSGQLQPVDAGGAFRGLSKELGAAELKDIRRQKRN